MKNHILSAILLVSVHAFAQLDMPDAPTTKVGKVTYLCTTTKIHVEELTHVFEVFGLKSGAFAIDIKTMNDPGKIWFLNSVIDKSGSEVQIRKNGISAGRCAHCYDFKPHHLLFESSILKIRQDQVSKKINLLMVDDSKENGPNAELQLEATCEFIR